MPITLTWHEIALRLALSVVAGGLIGWDRGEHGRPAGLRTTLLVCLAAAVAMIQTNLWLGTVGKAANSFVRLDPMRLPLGILTGMGFHWWWRHAQTRQPGLRRYDGRDVVVRNRGRTLFRRWPDFARDSSLCPRHAGSFRLALVRLPYETGATRNPSLDNRAWPADGRRDPRYRQ